MDRRSLVCTDFHSRSQWSEERLLLPDLLRAAGGRPGTFIELGALDGILYSNTLALERCFNWTGLLIEADPVNYAKLRASGRRAKLVHSGVCDDGIGSITLSTGRGATSGEVAEMTGPQLHRLAQRPNASHGREVAVPCRSLSRLMDEAGISHAHFLSLDVEVRGRARTMERATAHTASSSVAHVHALAHTNTCAAQSDLTRCALATPRERRAKCWQRSGQEAWQSRWWRRTAVFDLKDLRTATLLHARIASGPIRHTCVSAGGGPFQIISRRTDASAGGETRHADRPVTPRLQFGRLPRSNRRS